MLIVNADDWGLRPEVTDSILACWEAESITAASAMAHMGDSERAAEIAAESGLPLSLHLNLTTPFTAAAVPSGRRRRHQQAIAYFAGPYRRRFLFDPRRRDLLDSCVADQLEAYAEICGGVPADADGHEHIQVCPTVLSTRSLGRVETLREAHSFEPGRRSSAKRAHRASLNWALRRRFRSARFVSLRDLHPALGGEGLGRQLEASRWEDVEVMVHPADEEEREVLLSASWRSLMQTLPTGSRADLR